MHNDRLQANDVSLGDPICFQESGVDLRFPVAAVSPVGRIRVCVGEGIAMPLPRRLYRLAAAVGSA